MIKQPLTKQQHQRTLLQRSCTGLGAKPQDMTALSIDYLLTLTGSAPSGARCHNNVNTTEKLYNLTPYG